jgi:hypothetical protein
MAICREIGANGQFRGTCYEATGSNVCTLLCYIYMAHIPHDRNLIGYVLSNNTITYYQPLRERVTEKGVGGTIQKAVR